MFTYNSMSFICSRRYVSMFYLDDFSVKFAARYFQTQAQADTFLDRIPLHRRAGIIRFDPTGFPTVIKHYIHNPAHYSIDNPEQIPAFETLWA
jgi:hypothetical protein